MRIPQDICFWASVVSMSNARDSRRSVSSWCRATRCFCSSASARIPSASRVRSSSRKARMRSARFWASAWLMLRPASYPTAGSGVTLDFPAGSLLTDPPSWSTRIGRLNPGGPWGVKEMGWLPPSHRGGLMRHFQHAAARPATRRRFALLAAVIVSVLLAATGVVVAQTATDTPILYRLDKGSNYEQGCFGPCLCPVLVNTPAAGTFVLTPAGFDPLFNYFKVTEVNWIMSINGTDTLVTGSGTYKVGGEFAVQQQLSLDLKVGDNA